MNEESLAELIKAFELINAADNVEYEYRLYYNNEGQVYATAPNAKEATEYNLTGDYIVVDRDIYIDAYQYEVKGGKAVIKKKDGGQYTALEKGREGFTTVKNNAGLLLEAGEQYTNTDTYGYPTR